MKTCIRDRFHTEVFNKEYDGESLCDLSRDIHEALDGQYNDVVNQIPADEYGFCQGTFTVSIEWKPNNKTGGKENDDE